MLGTPLLAQSDNSIDSLVRIASEAKGIERFERLFDITFEYIARREYQKAIDYTYEAENVALTFADSLRIVKAGRVRAQVMRRMELHNESIKQFLVVLPISQRNRFDKETIHILNGLGLSYTLQSEYDKALEFHFQSLLLREEEGDPYEIFVTLNNIGLVYFKLKNYERALDYYFRSVKYDEKLNQNPFRPVLYINIGLCYNQLSKFDESQMYIRKGLSFCSPECDTVTLIDAKFGLGVAAYGQQNDSEARENFTSSYNMAAASGDRRFQLENLVYLARIATRENNIEEAKQLLTKAENLASNTSYNLLLIEIYRAFASMYNQSENFKQAAAYQNKYIQLKDSIYSEELIKNIAKVQTNFDERENKKIIQDKNEQIQRQRSLNVAIVIIAILAGLLVFVLFRSNQVKRKVNKALSQAKAIIEDQNRQLLTSNYDLDKELKEKNTELQKANESLLRVNEELDNFIYKTSHDIRGPLASLKGMCNVALMDVVDPVALGYLKKLDITAEKLNTILTRLLIVNQINNSAIGHELIDFQSILSDVLLLEKKKGLPDQLKIRKHIDDGIEFYSDKEFVRIILENLIDNAIKFYNDSGRVEPFVDISVVLDGQFVKIKVIDNGIGISEVHPDKIFQMFSRASERSETGGIGLYITKTATEKLGGSVHLKSSPEGHTEFYVKIPLVPHKIYA